MAKNSQTAYFFSMGLREENAFFPETSSELMAAISDGDDEALNKFGEIYYWPLVRLVICRGLPLEEAKDLVHDFFYEVILRQRQLLRLDPIPWQLRTFLRKSLIQYMHTNRQKGRAQKRGGHLLRTTLSEDKLPPTAPQAVPEHERRWAKSVMSRVCSRMRRQFRKPGEESLYSELERYIPRDPESDVPLSQLAETHGVTRDTVSGRLKRMRQSYCRYLYEEVERTSFDPADTRDEIKNLLMVLE